MADTVVVTARPGRVRPAAVARLAPAPGRRLKAAIVFVDAVVLVAGLALGHELRTAIASDVPGAVHDSSVLLALGAVPLWLAIFGRYRLYGVRHLMSRLDEFSALVHAVSVSIIVTAGATYLVGFNAARGWLVMSAFVVIPLLTVERTVVRGTVARLRRRGRLLRPVLIVGDSVEAHAIGTDLMAHPAHGYQILGFVRTSPGHEPAPPRPPEGPPTLGQVDEIDQCLASSGATGVIIATTGVDCALSNRLARDLTSRGLLVVLSSSLHDITAKRLTVRELGRYPVVHVEPVRHGWRAAAKRGFDIAMSVAAIVVLSPLLAVIAALIKATSRGPVLFRQERVGLGGGTVEVLKFRTMVLDAEAAVIDLVALNETDGPLFKIRNDPRVTSVGRILRRFSLDELPQLVNILKGDMSLVGPRPALRSEMAGWPPELHQRLRVRPGLTGMWQVSGRSDAPFEDYVRLDLYYVDNWSLLTDLVIILRTIPVVCLGRGSY